MMATAIQASTQIEGVAKARYIRVSPQKARLVIDLIRGRKVQDALQTLRFTPKRSAKHIEKVLRSAIANAERKAEDAGAPLDVDELFVSQCFVNEGARWKRLRPAPMGRAFRYQKRTAHLWVGVAEHHVLVLTGHGMAYAFRHALLREAIYDDTFPGERLRLHRAIAEALAANSELATAGAAAELAHHWYAAGELPAALDA